MARADSEISFPWKGTRTDLKPGVQLCESDDVSLLWVETIVWPKFHMNQRLLQPSCLPLKWLLVSASLWSPGNHTWLWGRARRCRWEIPITLSIPHRAWRGQQHLLQGWQPPSWTSPTAHMGICTASGVLTRAAGTPNLALGSAKRPSQYVLKIMHLGLASSCFWRKLCSSEKCSSWIFSCFNYSNLPKSYLLVCLKFKNAGIKKNIGSGNEFPVALLFHQRRNWYSWGWGRQWKRFASKVCD